MFANFTMGIIGSFSCLVLKHVSSYRKLTDMNENRPMFRIIPAYLLKIACKIVYSAFAEAQSHLHTVLGPSQCE